MYVIVKNECKVWCHGISPSNIQLTLCNGFTYGKEPSRLDMCPLVGSLCSLFNASWWTLYIDISEELWGDLRTWDEYHITSSPSII